TRRERSRDVESNDNLDNQSAACRRHARRYSRFQANAAGPTRRLNEAARVHHASRECREEDQCNETEGRNSEIRTVQRSRRTADFWDDTVKRLIRGAKKRGYVTHDQINALLPSEEVKSEQIEDILAMFNDMAVNVIETKETEPEETPEDVKEE